MVYALVHGMGRAVVDVVVQPIQTRIIAQFTPKEDIPPPPPLVLKPPPPPYIPPPEIVIQAPAASQNAITAITREKPAEAPAVQVASRAAAEVPKRAVHVAPVVDPEAHCRPPEYPAASRRSGESGAVVLRFDVDADGRVIDNDVESTSGYPRLDQAAKNALALCRFTPGTVDGKPVRAVAHLQYVWTLR